MFTLECSRPTHRSALRSPRWTDFCADAACTTARSASGCTAGSSSKASTTWWWTRPASRSIAGHGGPRPIDSTGQAADDAPALPRGRATSLVSLRLASVTPRPARRRRRPATRRSAIDAAGGGFFARHSGSAPCPPFRSFGVQFDSCALGAAVKHTSAAATKTRTGRFAQDFPR